jgi:beta-phosphoglucomutase-like phosphatase (HAD superfamily)
MGENREANDKLRWPRMVSSLLSRSPGVGEALEALRLPVRVAWSSVPEQIHQKLELTDLLAPFGGNLFSATWWRARSRPLDVFLYAAQKLATAPERCVVIEDSPAGIQAAVLPE